MFGSIGATMKRVMTIDFARQKMCLFEWCQWKGKPRVWHWELMVFEDEDKGAERWRRWKRTMVVASRRPGEKGRANRREALFQRHWGLDCPMARRWVRTYWAWQRRNYRAKALWFQRSADKVLLSLSSSVACTLSHSPPWGLNLLFISSPIRAWPALLVIAMPGWNRNGV